MAQPSSSGPVNHDCGPWVEAPNSSRLTRYRYDYGMGELQVEWRNRRGDVYTTYKLAQGTWKAEDTSNPDPSRKVAHSDSTTYRKFALAVSKGRYVNTTLDGFQYWKSTPDELGAPSNPNRRAVATREDGVGTDYNYQPGDF